MKWIVSICVFCTYTTISSVGPLENLVSALHDAVCHAGTTQGINQPSLLGALYHCGEKTTCSITWYGQDQDKVLKKTVLTINSNDAQRTISIETLEEELEKSIKNFVLTSSPKKSAAVFANCSPKDTRGFTATDFSFLSLLAAFKASFWHEQDRPLSLYESYDKYVCELRKKWEADGRPNGSEHRPLDQYAYYLLKPQ